VGSHRRETEEKLRIRSRIAPRPFRRGQRPDAKRSAGLRHGVVSSRMKACRPFVVCKPRHRRACPHALRQGMSPHLTVPKHRRNPLTPQTALAFRTPASPTEHCHTHSSLPAALSSDRTGWGAGDPPNSANRCFRRSHSSLGRGRTTPSASISIRVMTSTQTRQCS
jgi:hypothetical protein